MAVPRKKTVVTPQSPSEAIDLALRKPFHAWGVIGGAADRFGAELITIAALQRLTAGRPGSKDEVGLTLILAQLGVPGDTAQAELDQRMYAAFSAGLEQGVAYMLPVATAGIALRREWVQAMPAELRHSMAEIVKGLSEQMELVLQLHGATRADAVAATLRTLREAS